MDRDDGWRREWRALFGFARALAGNAADAEDLAQEAVWRYLRRRGDEREDPAALRPLLFTIARRLHCDGHRRRTPRAERVDPDAIPSGWRTPSEEAEAFERRAAVEAALASLPPNWRAALFLADGLDCSIREIAQVLETSEEAVRVTLYRARRRFRANLERTVAREAVREDER